MWSRTVCVLDEVHPCDDFAKIKCAPPCGVSLASSARRRVCLASLYLGNGPLEAKDQAIERLEDEIRRKDSEKDNLIAMQRGGS